MLCDNLMTSCMSYGWGKKPPKGKTPILIILTPEPDSKTPKNTYVERQSK